MWVKIEGITSEEDALLAVAMGADALGFVFAPSPRQMAPNKVRDILTRLPPEVLTIGVFRALVILTGEAWIAYLICGGILVLGGAFCWRLRLKKPPKDAE